MGGGDTLDQLNDNWIYAANLNYWKEQSPKLMNLKRDESSMAQLIENYAIVFGGNTSRENNYPEDQWNNDTWIYNGNDSTWVKLEPQTKPMGRYGQKIAKINSGKVLLFGGATKTSLLYDTWLFTMDSIPASVNEAPKQADRIININQTSSGELIIDYSFAEPGNLAIRVFDVYGNEIFNSDKGFLNSGLQQELIHLGNIPAGVYFISITNNQKSIFDKFVVVK